jgi:bacterioferritin
MTKLNVKPVVAVLNRLLEAELAGVVRYTHSSFLVFGFGRIPIASWLRAQADESLLHAQQVGEWITTLGDYPSLAIGPLLDSHQHDIAAMLRESLKAESEALDLYRQLLRLVKGKLIGLEEFARQMIQAEELHAAEVDKMLRKPGELAAFAPLTSVAAAPVRSKPRQHQ